MTPPTAASGADNSRPWRSLATRFVDGRPTLGDVRLAPDGRSIAFVITRASVTDNEYRSQVWWAPADGSAPARAVTAGPHDRSPRWSPDGRLLAFTSRRGASARDTTVHVLPVDGPGEVRTVASMPDGISELEWSPDGRWLGLVARVPDERYSHDEARWQSPRKIETFFTRLDGEGWIFDRPNHVHVVPADGSSAPIDLTPGPHQHDGLSWLPDSSGIITAAQRHEGWDRDLESHLYSVPVGLPPTPTTEPLRVTSGPLSASSPSVSPDGTRVAFLGRDHPTTYPQNEHVGVAHLATGERSWISTALDRTFAPFPGARPPVWLDDARLLASFEDRGAVHLVHLDALGRSAPEPLGPARRWVQTFDACWHEDAPLVAAVAAEVDHPGRLVVRHGTAEQVVADPATTYLATTAPVGWERFSVPCADGSGEIDAWIVRPPSSAPGERHPVLLNVHGGPHTQYGETFFDEAQVQAAAGFVVIMSNPRGSSGREQSWGQAILGPKHHTTPGTGWGGADVDDVMAVLDAALARFDCCDPERVGMLGGSYGGWMATELAGRFGDRFRAFCSERAVNNLLSEEWSSDVATSFWTELGPTHLEDPDEYVRSSPVRRAANINRPMLLLHSEEDWRCPIVQAEELFVALRLLGKDVTFYRFPGEGHELSRSGAPLHRVQRFEIILEFFESHLRPTGTT